MRLPFKNHTVFAGFVGNDVEPRYLPSGDPVVSLRIKSELSYKVDGKWQKHEEWATAVFYRGLAKGLEEQGIRKGHFLHVEGRRHARSFKAQQGRGQPGVAHEIVVEDWHRVDIPERGQAEPPAAPEAPEDDSSPQAPADPLGAWRRLA